LGYVSRQGRLADALEGLICHVVIGRVLLRRGLVDPRASADHRPFVRFEKALPNELWQMDLKGHVPMTGGGTDGSGRAHYRVIPDGAGAFALHTGSAGASENRSRVVGVRRAGAALAAGTGAGGRVRA
jgi:hypothetical protein